MGYPRHNYYSNPPTTTSGLAATGEGAMISAHAINTETDVDVYLLLFDLGRSPVTGEVRDLAFPLPSRGYTEITEQQLTNLGFVFDVGLAWGLSTDPVVYTPPANIATCSITLVWK